MQGSVHKDRNVGDHKFKVDEGKISSTISGEDAKLIKMSSLLPSLQTFYKNSRELVSFIPVKFIEFFL